MLPAAELITAPHSSAPKFIALVEALVAPIVGNITALANLAAQINVDTAEGALLDCIGSWVGLPRQVHIPISGAFFSLDAFDLGWDQGSWTGPGEASEGVVVLSDSTYRAALRLKIRANHWRGRMLDYEALDVRLESEELTRIRVVDGQDMTMSVKIFGRLPSAELRFLIESFDLIPRPAGVRITSYVYLDVELTGGVWDDAYTWDDSLTWTE